MDLFEYARELNKDKESPLAGRMRPTTLDEVVGQENYYIEPSKQTRSVPLFSMDHRAQERQL